MTPIGGEPGQILERHFVVLALVVGEDAVRESTFDPVHEGPGRRAEGRRVVEGFTGVSRPKRTPTIAASTPASCRASQHSAPRPM